MQISVLVENTLQKFLESLCGCALSIVLPIMIFESIIVFSPRIFYFCRVFVELWFSKAELCSLEIALRLRFLLLSSSCRDLQFLLAIVGVSVGETKVGRSEGIWSLRILNHKNRFVLVCL